MHEHENPSFYPAWLLVGRDHHIRPRLPRNERAGKPICDGLRKEVQRCASVRDGMALVLVRSRVGAAAMTPAEILSLPEPLRGDAMLTVCMGWPVERIERIIQGIMVRYPVIVDQHGRMWRLWQPRTDPTIWSALLHKDWCFHVSTSPINQQSPMWDAYAGDRPGYGYSENIAEAIIAAVLAADPAGNLTKAGMV